MSSRNLDGSNPTASEDSQKKASSESEVRLSKVEALRDRGIEPWPANKKVSHTCNELIKIGTQVTNDDGFDETIYEIAGRLLVKREHGKTLFVSLRDRSGSIQLYLNKNVLGDESFDLAKNFFDLGDFIWAKGNLFRTKTGELTLKVAETQLMSKCLHPLPEKYHGLADVEQRYRQRYLDLMSNDDSREKFITRSKLVKGIRDFLSDREFLEVETPMLHPIPGGATARPFVTHHNTYDMSLFLRIAPELYLKRLVVGGFERVFEIGRNFRNEGISTKHNPEFTMLEFYMAYGDCRDGIDLTEGLIKSALEKAGSIHSVNFGENEIDFSKKFKRISMKDSLIEIGGLKPEKLEGLAGEKIFELFEEHVEPKLIQPTFITDYPIEVSPLSKRKSDNPSLADRFEFFIGGFEVANGFSELNDPIDQAERFKQQVVARESGDAEAHHYDADYVLALEYGLPPAVGVGVGIDRLMMLLTGTTSIKDVILFPTLKNKDEV